MASRTSHSAETGEFAENICIVRDERDESPGFARKSLTLNYQRSYTNSTHSARWLLEKYQYKCITYVSLKEPSCNVLPVCW